MWVIYFFYFYLEPEIYRKSLNLLNTSLERNNDSHVIPTQHFSTKRVNSLLWIWFYKGNEVKIDQYDGLIWLDTKGNRHS